MVLGIAAAHERFSALQLAGAMSVLGSIVAIWLVRVPAGGLEILAIEQTTLP
jgi:hypothetical protein